jgi:DNA-binding CsgD family transcriptional regulator
MQIDSKEGNLKLAVIVDALANAQFYQTLADTIEYLSGYAHCMIIWLDRDQRPVPLYSDLPGLNASIPTRRWLDEAYLLDPAFSLYSASKTEGVFALEDVSPDQFFGSSYYKKYYAVTGLSGEILILIRIGDSQAVLVTLASKGSTVKIRESVELLTTYFPVLASLCRRHQSAVGGEINFSAPLKKAFGNFGTDFLTEREREVVHLLLKGHSTRSIAELLELSVNTVKVYTKRFHKKLGVTSQAELFSLFFEAISFCPFDADIDPLTHYRQMTSANLSQARSKIDA